VKTRKGDLFTAPKGSYLAHACNCQGVWGSGVAKEFKLRFPASFLEYEAKCKSGATRGDILICKEENGHHVVCLFTSLNYGERVDPPELIIESTVKALKSLPKDIKIHMPLINSGFFKVPWEETEKILLESELDVTVWQL
jgi:ADP-ribose 1''-phosphate phosphatase